MILEQLFSYANTKTKFEILNKVDIYKYTIIIIIFKSHILILCISKK